MIDLTLTSAFLLGLMGAGHCLGMCGGIIGSLSMATHDQTSKWLNISAYQLGRISSYTIIGLIAGLVGESANELSEFPFLQTISGILLILMGFYISRIWMALTYLEKTGKLLWDKISPLSKKLLPVKNPIQALLLGGLWGWLPCGLVYSSLGYALSLGSPSYSTLFMFCFGLGTLPATLFAGGASLKLKSFLNNNRVRWITSILFVGFGVYTLMQVYFALNNGEMPPHHHH